jgi:hypothetical protein
MRLRFSLGIKMVVTSYQLRASQTKEPLKYSPIHRLRG